MKLLFSSLITAAVFAAATATQAAPPPAVFPLHVSANHRFLADATGAAFLPVGDAGWELVTQLNEREIIDYLDDRQRRGFNAIIVTLLEVTYASRAPAKIDGTLPFLQPGDFTRPNPAYFDYVHRALAAANQRGIAVWFCPVYLGWKGGPDGNYRMIKAAGPAVLRGFGRFVGEQFKDLPNLVWMVGGDFAVPISERWTGSELAAGIREGGATQLLTAHGGATDAVETFGNEPWLQLDNVYSYVDDLHRKLRVAYRREPARPFVLIETTYEGEYNAPPERIRRQAWWAMLSGAGGQFFGNSPIWHFGGPGLPDIQTHRGDADWRRALGSIGSRDVARLGVFFATQPWSELEPDSNDTLITSGRGAEMTFATAAATTDSRRAIIYVPSDGNQPRRLVLNLARFSGTVRAEWFNPARDAGLSVPTELPNRENVSISTPGDNGTGTNDWVLLLTAEKPGEP